MGVGYTYMVSVDIKVTLVNASLKYPYENGYFFDKSRLSKNNDLRESVSLDPIATSKEVFETLTDGAIDKGAYSQGIVVAKLPDGTNITWREKSSSSDKSPAINIDTTSSNLKTGLKTHKIHFIKGGN